MTIGAIICHPDGSGGYIAGYPSSRAAISLMTASKEPNPGPRPTCDLSLKRIPKPLHFTVLLSAVCVVSGLNRNQIRSDIKFASYVRARCAFYVLAREQGYSFQRIGKMVHRDHTTVLTLERKYKNDVMVRNVVNRAKRLLGIADHDA